ncbi:MAG: carboxypeptidase regulatory-like domain-containing protein [Bacteroidales bacterium]|nr:carboxypeptidase regulatory-like domain-containing protein [Bacteroidales bacterium]MCF8346521.1 carboxypeptidase regulatory-like domain-containing protein [Bacteroidales bacterium]
MQTKTEYFQLSFPGAGIRTLHVLVMSMLMCCMLLSCDPKEAVIYEAEHTENILDLPAEADTCATCSSGKLVKNIGGKQNGSVTFTSVKAPSDGLYNLVIGYAVSDDKSFYIQVNEQEISIEKICYNNAGKDKVSTDTITVRLQKGSNRIRFYNPHEPSPDLDYISLIPEPLYAHAISGKVTTNGAPVGNVKIALAGDYQLTTRTDKNGKYSFRSLPPGNYYVRPVQKEHIAAPYDYFVEELNADQSMYNFTMEPVFDDHSHTRHLACGDWKIEYDTLHGLFSLYKNEKQVLENVAAVCRIPETYSTIGNYRRIISTAPVSDQHGKGTLFEIATEINNITMVQRFRIYEDQPFIIAQLEIVSDSILESNYMIPVHGLSALPSGTSNQNKILSVPYDNDKWVRFNASEFGSSATSHEVTAIYNNTTRNGIVLGSLIHDTWKTAIKIVSGTTSQASVEVINGYTSVRTRDVLPHGKVAGSIITSSDIFIGQFDDWRKGMEIFAGISSKATGNNRKHWTKPFGWNSWGAIQFGISYEKMIQVSDYFATQLQPKGFENPVAYIGMDAGWNRLSAQELQDFVNHCRQNNQEAGIYMAPFAHWGKNEEALVGSTDFKYKDVYLYANGKKQYLDGSIALDPTHPAVRIALKNQVLKFKELGCKYLKVDFLTHASLEGDSYYDSTITTGRQAFTSTLAYLNALVGDDMFLNFAISPLFPGSYTNSRRISCDAWADIGNTEYVLNALTYGWWLGYLNHYSDGDHVVLAGVSEGENRARITSSIITGIFITGDDFSEAGSAIVKDERNSLLANNEILDLAKIETPFTPVESNTSNGAGNAYVLHENGVSYLAVFNFSDQDADTSIPLERVDLLLNTVYHVKELWSGNEFDIRDVVNIQIESKDVKVFQLIPL